MLRVFSGQFGGGPVQWWGHGHHRSSSVAFSCLLTIATECFGINLVIRSWVYVSFCLWPLLILILLNYEVMQFFAFCKSRYLMFCMNSLLLLTEIWQPSIMFCSLLLPFDYLLVVIINPDTFELWSNAVFCVLRNTFRYLMFCINSLLLLWTDVQGWRYSLRFKI
jgi:hypothetical protein